MKPVLIRSFFCSVFIALLSLVLRFFYNTQEFLTDVGGLSAFGSVFGTLYGIMAAFIIFEVWNQYNNTSKLIDEEASKLEGMYRLVSHLNDQKLSSMMKGAIQNYVKLVAEEGFTNLAEGIRNPKVSQAFRKIFQAVKLVNCTDPKGTTIYPLIIDHCDKLSQARTNRLTQSLNRMPKILKAFFYLSSLFVITTFIIMPFSQPFYAIFTNMVIGFIMALITQLVEDLDNPFKGYFNLTPEPFLRALKHIEEDY